MKQTFDTFKKRTGEIKEKVQEKKEDIQEKMQDSSAWNSLTKFFAKKSFRAGITLTRNEVKCHARGGSLDFSTRISTKNNNPKLNVSYHKKRKAFTLNPKKTQFGLLEFFKSAFFQARTAESDSTEASTYSSVPTVQTQLTAPKYAKTKYPFFRENCCKVATAAAGLTAVAVVTYLSL